MSKRNLCPRARDDERGVEHNVHDTQLTGAMVAQTCGAHQGAEVTSAWFEASGDLQSANEERDDVDEVRQRRGSRGEASDDGAARTKASWWRWYHVRQSRSTRGQSTLEGSRCGSRNRIPSSTLGLPLQYQCETWATLAIAQSSAGRDPQFLNPTRTPTNYILPNETAFCFPPSRIP